MWPITVQCRVLNVSVSGYHGHVARQASEAPRRYLSDRTLPVHIKAIHTQTRRGYGRPRIWRELRKDGVRVGTQRLQTLMRQHGIRAKGKKRLSGGGLVDACRHDARYRHRRAAHGVVQASSR